MSEYKCLESINSLYVEQTELGYNAIPCCAFANKHQNYVPNIEDLLDNPVMNEIREGFKGDWKRDECISCVHNEQIGKQSKRERSLQRPADQITRWDLRPGNTCNLKCAMCNPWNSSKWYEDIDVFKKYRGNQVINENNRQARESLDWDWIYKNCVDKAESIYIAGGEPFYMKSVQRFIKKLSQNEWNCKNTEILIQTNGVSNTPAFLDSLSNFKRLSFSISVDGWGSVNDLIRFPTQHSDFLKNTQELIDLNCEYTFFNITVQAMNLPNIDKLVVKLKETWNGRYDIHKLTKPNHLEVNCLKPQVVERVLHDTKVPELKEFYKNYKYNSKMNQRMQWFLADLDKKRGTKSRKIIPWCFE